MRRFATGFLAAALTMSMAPPIASADTTWAPANVAAAGLEDALPPGARNVLAAVRIVKGLGARNRVYVEARGVQRDLRGYYDAQIETARDRLTSREYDLTTSQLRAYWRVTQRLEQEKAVALELTEDEKNAARLGFQSVLTTEMTGSLLRVPRVRQGLTRAKEAIDDVRDGFDQARVALEGGNPVTALVGDLRTKLDRLDRYAQLGSLVSGPLGDALGTVSSTARAELERIDAAVDDATGAANSAISGLDSIARDIDEGLAVTRTVRADIALDRAADDLLDRVFAPRTDRPETDVVANALARDNLTAIQRNVGVAVGAIDPTDFRQMSDRVRAAILGRSLERIAGICGRLTGAPQRVQLDAAAAGEPSAEPSTPCELFGNTEALQAFIDSQQRTAGASPDAGAVTTTEQGDGGLVDVEEREDFEEFVQYSGAASGAALADASTSTSQLLSLTFEGGTDAGVASLTVTISQFLYLRGGEDGGPSGDQNCGATRTQVASGSGPTGDATSFELTVDSFELGDFVGALCQAGDGDLFVNELGSNGGRFDGQLDVFGLDGTYAPGILFSPPIPISAS